MANSLCGTGCLRLELDEQGGELLELIVEFEDEFEAALEYEDDLVVRREQVQRFKSDIKIFDVDLARFLAECGKCTNFQRNGKRDEFSRLLERAQRCLQRLEQVKPTELTEKEGESCEAN